jgi:hypothetical protein
VRRRSAGAILANIVQPESVMSIAVEIIEQTAPQCLW